MLQHNHFFFRKGKRRKERKENFSSSFFDTLLNFSFSPKTRTKKNILIFFSFSSTVNALPSPTQVNWTRSVLLTRTPSSQHQTPTPISSTSPQQAAAQSAANPCNPAKPRTTPSPTTTVKPTPLTSTSSATSSRRP